MVLMLLHKVASFSAEKRSRACASLAAKEFSKSAGRGPGTRTTVQAHGVFRGEVRKCRCRLPLSVARGARSRSCCRIQNCRPDPPYKTMKSRSDGIQSTVRGRAPASGLGGAEGRTARSNRGHPGGGEFPILLLLLGLGTVDKFRDPAPNRSRIRSRMSL